MSLLKSIKSKIKDRRLTLAGYTGTWVLVWLVLGIGVGTTGCRERQMPKPYANARLTYPAVTPDTFRVKDYPFQCVYPGQFTYKLKPSGRPGTRWVDFRWDTYGVTLHTTYLQTNLTALAQQTQLLGTLLQEKIPPSASIETHSLVLNDSSLNLVAFTVTGASAIPLELLVTDNHHHSFHLVVQFDRAPDRDSLSDIVDGLSNELIRLMASFTFTDAP